MILFGHLLDAERPEWIPEDLSLLVPLGHCVNQSAVDQGEQTSNVVALDTGPLRYRVDPARLREFRKRFAGSSQPDFYLFHEESYRSHQED
jgi:hypothetical protein